MTYINKVLKIENYIFALFLSYVLYGAIRSPILPLKKLAVLIFIVAVVALVMVLFRKKGRHRKGKFKNVNIDVITSNATFLIALSLLFLFVVQILLLTQMTAPIGWDVFDNFYGVTTLDQEYVKRVLSLNPNNQLFFFMMFYSNKVISFLDFTGSFGNTWLSWQVLNCVFVDISLYLIYSSAKRLFNTSVGMIAYALFWLSLGLSPWILVPYTDTMVLPFVCLIVYLYSILSTNPQLKIRYRTGIVIIIGSLLTLSFLMKPSSVIFFIAYGCIKMLQVLFSKWNKVSMVLAVVLFCSGFVTSQLFHVYIEKQSIAEIDKNMSKPWTLFVLMGMTGTGGYNDRDTQAVNQLKTPLEKKEYTKHEIQKRLSDKGVLGYLNFLAIKNKANTANGDFDWGWDGGDLVPKTESKSVLQTTLRNLYYPQTPQSFKIRFIMHFFYLVTLIGMAVTIFLRDRTTLLAILKLTFIGMILYLLFFEGGRSRYLIQFMPFLYLLSANGLFYGMKKLKGISRF